MQYMHIMHVCVHVETESVQLSITSYDAATRACPVRVSLCLINYNLLFVE